MYLRQFLSELESVSCININLWNHIKVRLYAVLLSPLKPVYFKNSTVLASVQFQFLQLLSVAQTSFINQIKYSQNQNANVNMLSHDLSNNILVSLHGILPLAFLYFLLFSLVEFYSCLSKHFRNIQWQMLKESLS